MFSTKLIAIVALAMAQEAVAFNLHRHGDSHKNFHAKRDIAVVEDVATVTDWTTITVYADGSLVSATSAKSFVKDVHTTPATSTSTSASAGFTSSANSTSSSTTTSSSSSSSSIFTPTTSSSSSSSSLTTSSSSLSEVPGAPSWVLTPIYTPTTLSTAVKTSSSAAAASPTTTANANANVVEVASTPSTTSTPVVAAVATTSSSAAAAATTASSSSSSSSGKRGLAYNSGSLLSPFLSSGTKCTWSYNWGQTADSSAPSDVEYIPMLWSPSDNADWASNAATAISNGATALLGYNECDNAGQCNLDAASAAAAFKTDMKDFVGKAKIGAPAITNSGNAGEGIDWLNSFITACDGECNFDFCPLHWYNAPDAEEFLSHVSKVHDACGKPVWITEFAPISGTDAEISSFLETVMDALDNDSTYDYVERYSYFMVATGSLLTSSTSLSTYGQTFAYY